MWIALALLIACPSPSDDADGDGLPADLDCDDADADVGPRLEYWTDGDSDGFGGGQPTRECEAPPFAVREGGDCDDGRADVFPGAAEACDEADQDCDGSVDEELPTETWYRDLDGDGFGNPSSAREGCAPEDRETTDSSDCDDGDELAFPGADEVCDGEDDDCDGVPDEEATDTTTWYGDYDGDGFGDASAPMPACEQPDGAVTGSEDCDDADAASFPGALEVCDGEDDDCDGNEDGCVVRGDAWPILAGVAILGDSEDLRIGEAVRSVGDVDGDGDDDLAATSFLGTGSGNAVHVFAGPLSGTLAPSDAWLTLSSTATPLGTLLTTAEDVDGSGRDDLVVASPSDPAASDLGGVVHLLLDVSATTTLDEAVTWTAPAILSSVAGGGDPDGNGVPDLAASSPHLAGEADLRGAAWVVLDAAAGGALADADVVIGPDTAAQRVGSQVAWIGDADGDGHDDLAVTSEGAYAPDGDNGGAVWWFTALPTGAITTADAVGAAFGEDANDGFGGTLASAGDFDGDGRDDVIAGAAREDSTSMKGVARVFTAVPSGPAYASSAALTIENDGAQDGLWSVAGLGDVDEDGRDDVIAGVGNVGALVLGGASGTVAASATDIRLLGAPQAPILGPAGDLDGDGIPDVAFASPFEGASIGRAGAVWVFSGSTF
jgi:hypothetical protein